MPEIILTKHAIKKAMLRGITLKDLNKTIRFPSKITLSKTSSAKKYHKNLGQHNIVVAVKRQNNKWIAVSAWKESSKSAQPAPKQFFLEKLINDQLLKLEKLFNRRS